MDLALQHHALLVLHHLRPDECARRQPVADLRERTRNTASRLHKRHPFTQPHLHPALGRQRERAGQSRPARYQQAVGHQRPAAVAADAELQDAARTLRVIPPDPRLKRLTAHPESALIEPDRAGTQGPGMGQNDRARVNPRPVRVVVGPGESHRSGARLPEAAICQARADQKARVLGHRQPPVATEVHHALVQFRARAENAAPKAADRHVVGKRQSTGSCRAGLQAEAGAIGEL